MKPCKRLEIVIEQPLAHRVQEVLESLDVPGYTFVPGAGGQGDRGLRREDDPTGTFTNCIFIIALQSDEEVQAVVEAIRPLLSRSGGMCLVSEASWVRH